MTSSVVNVFHFYDDRHGAPLLGHEPFVDVDVCENAAGFFITLFWGLLVQGFRYSCF